MIDSGTILLAFAWLLAASVAGWGLPARWQIPAITLSGAGLLGSLSPPSLAVLATATAGSVLLVRSRAGPNATAGFIVIVAIAYAAFLVRAGPFGPPGWRGAVVPLGMAYYVLRLIHYVIEGGRGSLRRHEWFEAVHYQLFPPVLLVGPINRFDDFLRDLRRRRWDDALFSDGLARILTGAVKIVLVANYLVGEKLDALRGLELGTIGAVYVDTVLFWINLYVQFSGYSDVAIGVGAVLGFRMPENFSWPFLARNIGDFWRRWHITLSNWCRDYVYMPVLARWRRPALAITTSMIVLGLWHEASIHYLLWGLYHASGLTVWRRFEAATRPAYERATRVARTGWDTTATLLTLHFVMFSYPVVGAIEKAIIRS